MKFRIEKTSRTIGNNIKPYPGAYIDVRKQWLFFEEIEWAIDVDSIEELLEIAKSNKKGDGIVIIPPEGIEDRGLPTIEIYDDNRE